MSTPGVATEPLSLLGITVRRASVSGRFFLVYGTGMSIFLGVVLAITPGGAFSTSFPVLLPIFAAVGSMGGLVVFSNDRIKGVLECLMAYGISPRRLFTNALAASLVLASVVLVGSIGVGVGVDLAAGHPLTRNLALFLTVYSIPMSYVSAAFAATIGMYWTALSSPRAGMNSPIGLAPFFGILPPVTTLVLFAALGIAGDVSDGFFLAVAAAVAGGVAVIVGLLLGLIGRLLRRERLLSPA